MEQKVKKDYSFQKNIYNLCVECLEAGVVPNPEVFLNALNWQDIIEN